MTLGSHQTTIGGSQECFTPAFITRPLGPFETDAATAAVRPYSIGSERNITSAENSLAMCWRAFGRVWLNPPFDRRVVGAFVRKMCEHGRGVMLLHVRPDTEWWQPVWSAATGILFLSHRVVFWDAAGAPLTIRNPGAKHFGKPANSGAPVALISFGFADATVLGDVAAPGMEKDEAVELGRLAGHFQPLLLPRAVLAVFTGTWRELLEHHFPEGDFTVAEAFAAITASHPKARRNRHPREKVRQVLNRGGFERVGRGRYRRATA